MQTPRRNAPPHVYYGTELVVAPQLTQRSQVLPKTICVVLLCIADVRLQAFKLHHQLPIPIRYHGFLFSPDGPLLRTTSQPNALISVLLLACMIPLPYCQTRATPRMPGPQSSSTLDMFRLHPSTLGE